MTINQFAEYISVDPQTIHNWMVKGLIPHYRFFDDRKIIRIDPEIVNVGSVPIKIDIRDDNVAWVQEAVMAIKDKLENMNKEEIKELFDWNSYLAYL